MYMFVLTDASNTHTYTYTHTHTHKQEHTSCPICGFHITFSTLTDANTSPPAAAATSKNRPNPNTTRVPKEGNRSNKTGDPGRDTQNREPTRVPKDSNRANKTGDPGRNTENRDSTRVPKDSNRVSKTGDPGRDTRRPDPVGPKQKAATRPDAYAHKSQGSSSSAPGARGPSSRPAPAGGVGGILPTPVSKCYL